MAVHSNDGQTWLTKLDRIGELSGNDKDIVFNNLGHIICTDMLLELNRELDERTSVKSEGFWDIIGSNRKVFNLFFIFRLAVA